MADTKQYIIGTSDQAGKLKHKDYIEWVDSETGVVIKAPGTTSTDKANGDIITTSSNLSELSSTRIYDAIDIEWAPYKINNFSNNGTVATTLRKTSDVINGINNIYSYAVTSYNNTKTAYNNLYSYVLTTYNNVRTSYNNLYSYTTTKCASIESNINNLNVSAGNYKAEINIPIMAGSSASKNNTTHVITGITQTDGKISYEYSGLYITPTLINDGITTGKFLTNITSENDEDNIFTMVRGNIDIIFDDSIAGNAITDLSVNSDGDIVYKKENIFATKTQLDSLTNKVDRKVINDSTINIYLSNTSTNGTSSSGSFTTNQSTNGSIHLNNVARTNSKNTFSDDQTATAWYVSSDINYKEIIDDCKITIDEISKLPIFDYIWKLDEEKKLHTGSSAQAVEEILPNLVTEDNRGIKNLDYAALGTIAGILACREICKLRDKIDKLDKIIENKL